MRNRHPAARAMMWWLAVAIGSGCAPALAAKPEAGDYAPYKLTTKQFEIEFSVPPAVGREYAVLCERAYANFRKKFCVPKDASVWDGKCRIMLFAGRDEFKRYAKNVEKSLFAMESGGYTTITKTDPRIVLFLDGKNHARLRQVLVHEMTHVFLQLFGKDVALDTWLHEGFAQHFEFGVSGGKARAKASRSRIKKLVKAGGAVPFERFWKTDFPATDANGYAQAWSLVDFMMTKGSPKRTGKFVLKLKEGATREEALKQTFGCSPEKFDKLWRRYVLRSY